MCILAGQVASIWSPQACWAAPLLLECLRLCECLLWCQSLRSFRRWGLLLLWKIHMRCNQAAIFCQFNCELERSSCGRCLSMQLVSVQEDIFAIHCQCLRAQNEAPTF